jgi:hypothetical protein
VQACPKCQRILADVNNRIEDVFAAIRHLNPKRLAEVTGAQAQAGESEVLRQVATVVGYEGQGSDGLLARVREWADEFRHDPVRGVLDEICTSLGLDAKSDIFTVNRAVAETAAHLDNALLELEHDQRRCNVSEQDSQEIARLRNILEVDSECSVQMLVDDVAFRFDRLRAELADAEQMGAWKDRILAKAAEAMGMPGLPPGDLIAQIKNLRETAGYYADVPALVETGGKEASGSSFELNIGGLHIKINGLPVHPAGAATAG